MEDKNVRFGIGVIVNIIVVIIAVVLIYFIGAKGFAFGAKVFDEQSVDTQEDARQVEVTIPVNITDSRLTDILYDRGLIEDKLIFKAQLALSEYKGKCKAGTYTVDTSIKPTQILAVLCGGSTDTEGTDGGTQ